MPIGLAGIALVTIFIDEMKEPTRTKFDLRGLILSGTALACLMFGIEVASRGVGSTGIVAALLGWVVHRRCFTGSTRGGRRGRCWIFDCCG